jgi:hypothetical protein
MIIIPVLSFNVNVNVNVSWCDEMLENSNVNVEIFREWLIVLCTYEAGNTHLYSTYIYAAYVNKIVSRMKIWDDLMTKSNEKFMFSKNESDRKSGWIPSEFRVFLWDFTSSDVEMWCPKSTLCTNRWHCQHWPCLLGYWMQQFGADII